MASTFFYPARSPFKQLFLGTRLGEELRAMSFAKAVPKGLKWVECETVSVERLSPYATFRSSILYRMPLRNVKIPFTSS
jgi:hypothetical protein